MPHVPVCVDCAVEMKVVKTGVIVEEMLSKDEGYKIWSADVHECPGCGCRLLAQFAPEPIAEHFQERYASWINSVRLRFWPKLDQVVQEKAVR